MRKIIVILLTMLAMQANAKTLVAYFSATGTTKAVAEDLARVGSSDLIPFATSGSSPIDGAVQFLRDTYPQYKWQDGKLLNEYTDDTLKEWIK